MKEISSGRSQRPLLPESTETAYLYASATEEVHPRDYFKVVVTRRRLVLLVFLIVLAIGSYTSFTATKMYSATTILKIEPTNPTVTGLGEIFRTAEGGGPYDYYQTEFKLLESRSLAAKVVRELHLQSNQLFTNATVTGSNAIARIRSWIFGNLRFVIFGISQLIRHEPKSEEQPPKLQGNLRQDKSEIAEKNLDVDPGLVGRYMGFLSIIPIRNTRLVEIRFTTPNPSLSRELADAHARGFIRMSLENRFELTREARDFLDVKNTELKTKLERSEDALNRFRQTHGVVSMDKGENIVIDRLVEVNKQLTGARTVRMDAEAIYKSVENKPPQYLSQFISQGLVTTLRSNLVALEAERVKLSTVYKPDHPRLIEFNLQIDETKRALNAEVTNVVRGIHENYLTTRAREQALQAEAEKQQKSALNLKELGVEYAVLQEEVNVNRALYESVLKRLSETHVSNDLAVSNLQITQLAEKPGGPSSPDIASDLLLSGFVGFILGVGLAFFLEYLDSTVSTPKHVGRAVALTTFGVVPDLNLLKSPLINYRRFPVAGLVKRLPFFRLSSVSVPPPELIVEHHPFSFLAESYRSIRTSLLFSQAEKPPQVILVTSPSPSDGKTVTTVNLAIALSQDRYKVLVIDADLRKGCCHSRLRLKNHQGLSNILSGNLTLQDGIQETSVTGLSLLSRGVCPPNPSDLLGCNKMTEVLTCLRELYDFILIDSPPAVALSDAAVLSVVSDGVFLVFHGQKTTTAFARQAVERLDAVHAPLLGVILNGVDLSNPDYAYYRHYYRYNYPVTEENNDIYQESVIETVGKSEESEPWKTDSDPETVSKEFLAHIISRLTDAAGPLAPVIVQDQIFALAESPEAFPKRRLKELLEKVSEEILDKTLRENFHSAVADQIQSL
jgi:succinoglycan biosynthesis transport protein ExoP